MLTVDIPQSVIDFGLGHIDDDSKVVRNDETFMIWEVNESPWEDLTISSGLVCRHNKPFNLHSDTFFETNRCNLIIPLQMTTEQSLLVMDQTYEDSAVWVPGAESNKTDTDPKNIFNNKPCDTDGVVGLTGEEVQESLIPYLYYDKAFYFGLTGTAWVWEIGKGGIFSPNQIHGTGNMNDTFKTTMTLWFDNTPEEVHACLTA